MNLIIVNDFEIELIKKNIKNLNLSVHPPNGRIRMAAPLHVSEETIRLFVISKSKWIEKNQEKFKNKKIGLKKSYLQGEKHYFNGERYVLNIFKTRGKQKVEVNGNKDINMYLRKNNTYESRKTLMSSFYRDYLKENIPVHINKWQPILNVKVEDFGIKQMKTRWGTCNTKAKRIWLNLELAKADRRSLEYVVVHEMIHLIEANHSSRFKFLMDKHLPNWKEIKKELNYLIIENDKWV